MISLLGEKWHGTVAVAIADFILAVEMAKSPPEY